jgi:hypothetical protein
LRHRATLHGSSSQRSPDRVRAIAAIAVLGVGLVCAAAALSEPPAISRLIDAERKLAAAARARGTAAAYLEHLDGKAVTFDPRPTSATRAWRERGEEDGGVEWSPELVEVSGWEDLGFSIGRWADRSGSGHFIRVWRRERGDDWKIVLDGAVSHPPPADSRASEITIEGAYHAPPDTNDWLRGPPIGSSMAGGVSIGGGGLSWGVGFGIGSGYVAYHSRIEYENERTAFERHQMMTAERTLGWTARQHGWERAYAEVSASDLRHLREDAAPTLGPESAALARQSRPRKVDWVYRESALASSWDLGYAYGLAIEHRKGSHRPDTSAFVHLWRKDEDHRWRLMADWERDFRKR